MTEEEYKQAKTMLILKYGSLEQALSANLFEDQPDDELKETETIVLTHWFRHERNNDAYE